MTKTFMLLVHADADGWADLDDAERLATSRAVPSPIRQPI
jgi:hypothetical protein